LQAFNQIHVRPRDTLPEMDAGNCKVTENVPMISAVPFFVQKYIIFAAANAKNIEERSIVCEIR